MKILTPVKAIRAKCLDCCCWQTVEVRLCSSETCSLHPYRTGKRPKKNKGTTEDMETKKTLASSTFSNKKSPA